MSAHDPTRPHPRTTLWLTTQRDKCFSCKHCQVALAKSGECPAVKTMRCKTTPKHSGNRYSHHEYCIDAREPGQPCGPDALLFAPKKAEA